MRIRHSAAVLALVGGLLIALSASVAAQIPDRLRRAAEDVLADQAERLLREAVRCALDDPRCPAQAEGEDKEVIYVDENGEVITDDDGVPITDRDQARERAGLGPEGELAAPGEGVWANYDFVPGDEILYYDDYSGARVGDFPRRMTFIRGNWEIVEWENRRLLRNTGGRRPAIEIPLPKELPERFTIEFDAHITHGNAQVAVATFVPEADQPRINRLEGAHFEFNTVGGGVAAGQSGGPQAMSQAQDDAYFRDGLQTVRIMVDGRYAKVYVNHDRVANVPNVDLERSRSIYLQTSWGTDASPILIGPVRVAAGGRSLYDDLLADGRATTRGILFATDSDRIRPESTPTLQEIGQMLEEHSDLRLRVEGHTDADGDDAYNLDLSERRAASVKRFLVESYDIEAGRLETAGLGESQPVAENESAEGKQKNRRVELVRLDEGGTP